MILQKNQFRLLKITSKSKIFSKEKLKKRKEKEVTLIIQKTRRQNNFQMMILIVKKEQSLNQRNNKKIQKAQVLFAKINKLYKWLLKQSHILSNLYCSCKKKRKSF